MPQLLRSIVAAIEAGRCSRAESLQFLAVGGGKVSELVLERAERLALPVYEGYGLTECASVVALNTPAARRRGSVGRPLDHVGVHVGSRSELVVHGAVMLGYVGDACAGQHYIATGDIGHIDADGFLYIDGRCKDVFISSFGRNVSPEWVEADLVAHDGIAQAAIFGEARPWNTAVIVPAVALDDMARLETAIAAANARLPSYAQVQRWIVAAEPFTPANGLLTQNGRIRRAAIWDRYAEAIDASYRDELCSA